VSVARAVASVRVVAVTLALELADVNATLPVPAAE
jgi:hypothetical protein